MLCCCRYFAMLQGHLKLCCSVHFQLFNRGNRISGGNIVSVVYNNNNISNISFQCYHKHFWHLHCIFLGESLKTDASTTSLLKPTSQNLNKYLTYSSMAEVHLWINTKMVGLVDQKMEYMQNIKVMVSSLLEAKPFSFVCLVKILRISPISW